MKAQKIENVISRCKQHKNIAIFSILVLVLSSKFGVYLYQAAYYQYNEIPEEINFIKRKGFD